jgi:hypothetical protein
VRWNGWGQPGGGYRKRDRRDPLGGFDSRDELSGILDESGYPSTERGFFHLAAFRTKEGDVVQKYQFFKKVRGQIFILELVLAQGTRCDLVSRLHSSQLGRDLIAHIGVRE